MSGSEGLDLSKLRIEHGDDQKPSASPPRSKKLYGWLIALLVVALAVVFIIARQPFAPAETVELTTVSFVSASQASSLLTASGYVVAQRKAAIASKATGRLVFLGFEEGDRVTLGQIIARIESDDVEAGLAQAKANLAVNKADLTDAKNTLDRVTGLVKKELGSQADYDAARARYDRVQASIEAAAAAVKAAEVQLENTRIRAPFNGTILTKNADVGEVVAPFGAGASSKVAVVTIADMSSLEVEADVSESNIEKIVAGGPCEIVLDAYPEKRYRGSVSKIVPTADRSKATVMVKVRFADRDARVLPEMSSKVYFLPAGSNTSVDSRPMLAVNASAVIERGGRKVVFLYKNSSVTKVPVTAGRALGSMVEITEGLSAGDRVILVPPEGMEEGRKVKIKE